MDKIYRRPTQLGGTPKKKKNEKARKRNIYFNFRVSPGERAAIEARIAMSGLPKARFFIESCLYQKVLVKGNVRTFSEIKTALSEIMALLEKDPKLEHLDPVHAECLRMIMEIVDKRFEKGGDDNGKIV